MTILQKQYKSLVLAINDANDDVGDWHFVRCFYCKGEDAGQEKLIVLLHDGGWSADALSLHRLQLSSQAHSELR